MYFQSIIKSSASLSSVCGTIVISKFLYQQQATSCEDEKHNFKFPKSQLFIPSKPYPEWDPNWDFRSENAKEDSDTGSSSLPKQSKPNGATRHILLVRHGQYDETYPEDEKRILTKIGREQAAQTGKRLMEMITHEAIDKNGMKHEKSIKDLKIRLHVSNMARAKETASIISQSLPSEATTILAPNALLNEGRPCHVVPEGRGKGPAMSTKSVHRDSARIEAGFRDIFYRAQSKPQVVEEVTPTPNPKDSKDTALLVSPLDSSQNKQTSDQGLDEKKSKQPKKKDKGGGNGDHEYDIVVCHGNVIRYFALRALQLPPEAWLRLCTFNCSITYLIVRPNGSVSLRTLGDIGHMDMDVTTFSGHHGIDW